mmetsp:Transcript_51281/g.111301  ORF Transcript_51281/g.111301 Transcript_51281/m.111301 type:complete len:233 (-) Transcript_51281:3-701(-)
MLEGELVETHGILWVPSLLFEIHLQGCPVDEIEVLQILVALFLSTLQDLRSCHSIRESVVRDDVVKFAPLLLLNGIHVLAHFLLQPLGILGEFLWAHAVPTEGGIWADGFANGDVVCQLEDFEIGLLAISWCGICLHLTWIDGVALHARHGVEGLVEGRMQDATAWSKLTLSLPVVCSDLEHQHLLLLGLTEAVTWLSAALNIQQGTGRQRAGENRTSTLPHGWDGRCLSRA